MRADLSDAEAAVSWAVSHLPTLKRRLEVWGESRRYDFFFDPHPEVGKKIIKLVNVQPLDPLINGDVGAIINSIRSSLDILVYSVAKRHTSADPKRIYFPVASSEHAFATGDYPGSKGIQSLPDRERKIIEELCPWRGGNRTLVALHNLDITRKHRRLIDIGMIPWAASVSPIDIRNGLELVPVWPGLKNDAVIGQINIDAPDSYPKFALQVQFDESLVPLHPPLVETLCDFANFAYRTIRWFDY